MKEMIRVLHLINGADLGGISSMILNYYQYIDRDKIHFDFVSPLEEEGVNGKKLQEMGCKFYHIKKKSDGLWNHIKELDKLMKNEHFDAIHVHSNHTSYVGLMVAWKNGIKVRIAHGHNAVKSKLSLKGRITRRSGIILIKVFSTKRLACSKDAAVYTFGKHSLKEKSLQILPNAIDVNKFCFNPGKREKLRKELGIDGKLYVVGCVGRMSPEKNHIFLVRLLPEVSQKCPQVKLMLVGDGVEKDKIYQEAVKLGVEDSVIFTGARSDVSELLNVMDVFVFPSLNEGLGIVALEASAAGLPVVMSENIPKELSFIPDSRCLVLSEADEWVKAVLSYSVDKNSDRVERMRKSVKMLGDKHYDICKEVRSLEELYRNRGGY